MGIHRFGIAAITVILEVASVGWAIRFLFCPRRHTKTTPYRVGTNGVPALRVLKQVKSL